MAAVTQSIYKSYMTDGLRTLSLSSGPSLGFTRASINLTLPKDSDAIPPSLFKLDWAVPETSKLNHKLESLLFSSSSKTRFVLPLPDSRPLEGAAGELPFSASVPSRLVEWVRTVGAGDVTVTFTFRSFSDSSSDDTSKQTLGNSVQHAQNDVVFVFPPRDSAESPRLLWSKAAALSKSSPYFKTLFASEGFTETSEKIQAPKLGDKALALLNPKKPAKSANAVTTTKEKSTAMDQDKDDDETILDQPDWEDSDMETDSFPSPTSSPSIHRITITSVAYKTLFSYLYYLETGIINFSPLTSLLPASYVPNSSLSSNSVPSCSPKSMYRLASFYEHQGLREASYTSISSQLDSRNALTELFSDLASDYEEIKFICTQAVLDNWNFVKDSKEMKEVEREMKEGKLEERKVEKVFELFGKLKPATA